MIMVDEYAPSIQHTVCINCEGFQQSRWFTISDDYTINIKESPLQPGYEALKQHDGTRLKLLKNESLWLAQYYLQAHRERV